MTKFFIILALTWLAYTYFKNTSGFKNTSSSRTKNQRDTTTSKKAEDIIPCAHCGLHIPKSESLIANNQYFCSDAHRRAFLK